MMRSWVMVLLLVPAVAEAQPTAADPAPRPSTLPPIGLPLAPIGLQLAPLGLPLLPDGTPTQSPTASAGRATEPRSHPPGRREGHRGGAVIVIAPPYFWTAPPSASPPATPPGPAPAAPGTTPAPEVGARGTIWLDVEPHGVGEVYVDDYLVGTAADLRGTLTVEPGPHRVEIRASEYEPLRVDVRVEPGGAVTVRRTLLAARPPTAAASARAPQREVPPPPIPRKPFYFIPGCYLGDVPPAEARLPVGCDPSKTVVVSPR